MNHVHYTVDDGDECGMHILYFHEIYVNQV